MDRFGFGADNRQRPVVAAGEIRLGLCWIAASRSCHASQWPPITVFFGFLAGESAAWITRSANRRSKARTLPVSVQVASGTTRRSHFRLHTPVSIGFCDLNLGERGNLLVMRCEMADRIGGMRIAGDRESLTAAAAKVDLAPRAASAWLLHPVGAAKGVKCWRIRPDVGQRVLAH